MNSTNNKLNQNVQLCNEISLLRCLWTALVLAMNFGGKTTDSPNHFE